MAVALGPVVVSVVEILIQISGDDQVRIFQPSEPVPIRRLALDCSLKCGAILR